MARVKDVDRQRGRVNFSTGALERFPGDMLTESPQVVYRRAREDDVARRVTKHRNKLMRWANGEDEDEDEEVREAPG